MKPLLLQYLNRKIVLFTLLLAGCSDRKVEVYEIPKEKVAMESMEGKDGQGLVPPLPSTPVKWQKPNGWQEKPLSEMRQGSFNVVDQGQTADVSVISFPGEAGGLASNVNRWRGQLQLSPMTEDDLRKTLESLTVDGIPGYWVDMQTDHAKGGGSSRILGAVLQVPDRTWFVKMTGPIDLLGRQKDKFLDFVRSFRFSLQGSSAKTPEDQNSKPNLPQTTPTRSKSTND